MPFSLYNILATFQAYINRALVGLVNIYCVVYLDNILVYSDIYKQYIRDLREVLKRLRKFALYTSFKKYKFFTNTVEFLSYTVSVAGVSIDKSRISIVEE
jgi:predicted O-methyltransferase YrrM